MKVISVKFKENGRAYYFDPGTLEIRAGDFVVVTTARGTECGEVVRGPHEVPGYKREIKPVLRMADAVDVRRMRQKPRRRAAGVRGLRTAHRGPTA